MIHHSISFFFLIDTNGELGRNIGLRHTLSGSFSAEPAAPMFITSRSIRSSDMASVLLM